MDAKKLDFFTKYQNQEIIVLKNRALKIIIIKFTILKLKSLVQIFAKALNNFFLNLYLGT